MNIIELSNSELLHKYHLNSMILADSLSEVFFDVKTLLEREILLRMSNYHPMLRHMYEDKRKSYEDWVAKKDNMEDVDGS